MEVEFDVKITPGVLYDYLLGHTYRSLAGISGTVVGLVLIMGFAMTRKVPFLIAGLVIILYLPWTLFIKSRQQYLTNESFKKPLHYRLSPEGVEVSQDDTGSRVEWSEFTKAISTGSSILLYTSRVNACILPKKDLGDMKSAVIAVIYANMDRNKVHIRGN